MLRVGLNGFGRIGRAIFRIVADEDWLEIVAVNDRNPNVENHAYLLKYDSTYGRFEGEVSGSNTDKTLTVNGRRVQFHAQTDISKVPWEEQRVQVVIEATGVPMNLRNSRSLLERDAVGHVVVTNAVKAERADQTIIFGVNEGAFNPREHKLVATSTCDANACGPILHALEGAYGIEEGFVTTLHPWLSYQNVLDGSAASVASPTHTWEDFALGRASPGNLIPKDTSLITALAPAIGEVAKRVQAVSFRTPTNIVSAADLTLQLRRPASAAALNNLAEGLARKYPRVAAYQTDSTVSLDYLRTPYSLSLDGRWTRSTGKLVKLILWYDNEWGYSNRVIDTVRLVAGE